MEDAAGHGSPSSDTDRPVHATNRVATSLWSQGQRQELQANVHALFERFSQNARSASSESGGSGDAAIEAAVAAASGDDGASNSGMTCGQAVAFARETNLLDLRLGSADVDISFARVRLAKKRTINETQFAELLRLLAIKRNCTYGELVARAAVVLDTPGSTSSSGRRTSAASASASATASTSTGGDGTADGSSTPTTSRGQLLGRPFFHHELALQTIQRSLNRGAAQIDAGRAVQEGETTAVAIAHQLSAEMTDKSDNAYTQGANTAIDSSKSASTGDEAVLVKSGWLVKQGAIVKNWKRRWFVLRSSPGSCGDVLSYYAKAEDSAALGQIVLDASTVVGQVAVDVRPRLDTNSERLSTLDTPVQPAAGRGISTDGSPLRTRALKGLSIRDRGRSGGNDKDVHRKHEFTISRTSGEGRGKARAYRFCAASSSELGSWMEVLCSSIAGNVQQTWADDKESSQDPTESVATVTTSGDDVGTTAATDASATQVDSRRRHTFRTLWSEVGVRGFVVHFQVLKRNERGKLQPRIFEINFLDRMLYNTWRGGSKRSFKFADIESAEPCSAPDDDSDAMSGIDGKIQRQEGVEKGCHLMVRLRDGARHPPWVLELDSSVCRDRLLDFLRLAAERGRVSGEYANSDVTTESTTGLVPQTRGKSYLAQRTVQRLLKNCRRLVLRQGYLERRITTAEKMDGAFASTERLWVVLQEDSLRGYPSPQEANGRPWFICEGLRAISLSRIASQGMLCVGRAKFNCPNPSECEAWFDSIQAAAELDAAGITVERELAYRRTARASYGGIVKRLRALLEARTDADGDSSKMAREGVDGSVGDASVDAILATDYTTGCANDGSPLPVAEMLCRLWALLWPGVAWGGVRGEKWSELGFQRGGPASDLRGSGRLGLHTLLHFVLNHRETFDAMIASQKRVEDEGKVLSYPVSIACINVTAVLVELLGLGDAGSRRGGASTAAVQGFASLVLHIDERSRCEPSVHVVADFVFEEIFAIFFPVLDRIFLEMQAGYMEFMAVLDTLRDIIDCALSQQPRSIAQLRELTEGAYQNWLAQRQAADAATKSDAGS